MKNLRDKIRTKSFWVSLAAAAMLVLQTLGVQVNVPYVNEVIEAVCALLVLAGIFTAPAAKEKPEDGKTGTDRETDADSDNAIGGNHTEGK